MTPFARKSHFFRPCQFIAPPFQLGKAQTGRIPNSNTAINMCICAELRSALSVLAEGSPTSMSTSAEQVSREAILSAIRPCMPSLKLLCIPTASSNLASYLLSDSNHVPSREEFSRGIGPSVVSALEAVFERKRMPVLVDCANKGHLEELVAARLTWEESLADELQAISRETDRPILQLR